MIILTNILGVLFGLSIIFLLTFFMRAMYLNYRDKNGLPIRLKGERTIIMKAFQDAGQTTLMIAFALFVLGFFGGFWYALVMVN